MLGKMRKGLCLLLVAVMLVTLVPDAAFSTQNVSVEPLAFHTAPMVAAGGDHIVALRNDGTVWTWGSNWKGQLGDGTTTTRNTPVQVQNLSNVTAVAAGADHTVALRNDGTVWAWGCGNYGQLGNGNFWDSGEVPHYRTRPVQTQNLNNVTAIAAGGDYTVALRNNGTVWAWGGNFSEMGGTISESAVPVQVQNFNNVTAIAVGGDSNSGAHAVALRSDGTVWTWGANWADQLGNDPGTAHRATPAQVPNLNNVTAVAAGNLHTAVLRSDGTVWAWGFNDWGQLGDNTTTDRHTPVQVRGPGGAGFLNLSTGTPPRPPGGPSHWAEEDVSLSIWSGLVPSHLQSDYTQAITRAEFAALAVTLYESQRGQISGRIAFIDTDDISVQKAAYIGVVRGVGDNLFAPEVNLSRQEGATMLSRLADAIERPLPRQAPAFLDNNTISSWAVDAVGHVHTAEIMRGIGDGTFNPLGEFTRQESIVTMLRMFTFAWGSPLENINWINDDGWDEYDWANFDGWVFEDWESAFSEPLLNSMHIEVASIRPSRGGQTQVITHHAGWIFFPRPMPIQTHEFYLSEATTRSIISVLRFANNALDRYSDVKTIIDPIPGIGSLAVKFASMMLSMGADGLEEELNQSHGFGIILTMRQGHRVGDNVPVRSQFRPFGASRDMVIIHDEAPFFRFPNDPAGPVRGGLDRGQEVRVIGIRNDAFTLNSQWSLLDTGYWVLRRNLAPAQVAITTSVYPRQNETAPGIVLGVCSYGTLSVRHGERVQITAQPNAGWEFDGWYVGNRLLYSRNASLSFVAEFSSGSRHLTARFRPFVLVGPQRPVDIEPIVNANFYDVKHLFGTLLESEQHWSYGWSYVFPGAVIEVFRWEEGTFVTEINVDFGSGAISRTQYHFRGINGNSTRTDVRNTLGTTEHEGNGWDGELWWHYSFDDKGGRVHLSLSFGADGRVEYMRYMDSGKPG